MSERIKVTAHLPARCLYAYIPEDTAPAEGIFDPGGPRHGIYRTGVVVAP